MFFNPQANPEHAYLLLRQRIIRGESSAVDQPRISLRLEPHTGWKQN